MAGAGHEEVKATENQDCDPERTQPEWTHASPLNPFEATFSLLKSLRDEIKEVRDDLAELRASKIARFLVLEDKVEKFMADTEKRSEALYKAVADSTKHVDNGFEQRLTELEQLRTVMNARFGQLDAQMKAEMSIRFEQKQELDKKIREEAKSLLSICEKTGVELTECNRRVEMNSDDGRRRHDELRQDVEKLAALLSDSSMTRDPFKILGYRPTTPSSGVTSLGSTAHGNNLPPLVGSTKANGFIPTVPAGNVPSGLGRNVASPA